jgi:hypothetical protein
LIFGVPLIILLLILLCDCMNLFKKATFYDEMIPKSKNRGLEILNKSKELNQVDIKDTRSVVMALAVYISIVKALELNVVDSNIKQISLELKQKIQALKSLHSINVENEVVYVIKVSVLRIMGLKPYEELLEHLENFDHIQKSVFFMSHKWYTNVPDDPKGFFYQKICEFNDDDYLWIDYCCTPQINVSINSIARALIEIPKMSFVKHYLLPELYEKSLWCQAESSIGGLGCSSKKHVCLKDSDRLLLMRCLNHIILNYTLNKNQIEHMSRLIYFDCLKESYRVDLGKDLEGIKQDEFNMDEIRNLDDIESTEEISIEQLFASYFEDRFLRLVSLPFCLCCSFTTRYNILNPNVPVLMNHNHVIVGELRMTFAESEL